MRRKIFILCATKSGLDLIKLINNQYKIDYVITPKISKKSTSERISAKKFCLDNKINCFEINSYSNLEVVKKFLKKKKIDILICISWQRIIPLWLIKKARIACLGAHGSHDGMYLGKGRSPVNWAILSGKKIFKLSLFQIKNEAVDEGQEIASKKFIINYTDDVNSIYIKIHLILSDMIINFLKKPKKKLPKYKGKHRFLPKIAPEDGMIDWNRSALDIYNFIRSKSWPYPRAFVKYKNFSCEILAVKLIEQVVKKKEIPGTVTYISTDNGLLVQAKNGLLLIYISKKYLKYIKVGNKFNSANFESQIKNIIKRHYRSNPKQKLNKMILDFVK